jgi:hypothetical protein
LAINEEVDEFRGIAEETKVEVDLSRLLRRYEDGADQAYCEGNRSHVMHRPDASSDCEAL